MEELRNIEALEGISRQTMEQIILPRGNFRDYGQGTAIYRCRDRVTEIKILLSGRVELVNYTEEGERDLRSLLFPGSVVGLDLVGTKTQLSPYDAVAAERSRVFSFPAGLIFEDSPVPERERLACMKQLMQMLSHINMKKEYRLAILTHHSLRERIMTYLTMQANRRQTKTFTIPLSREELASFLCVNRSALSHELSLLRREGVIEFQKNTFTLIREK